MNIKLICCPICQSDLEKKSEFLLFCKSCDKEYIIKHDIPVLLKERI
jgi:uncharacterized protein YbaR (Trm112 family)